MQKSIREIVHDYPTKHKKGFLKLEMLHLLNQFPNINLLRFNDALDHITIMYIDNEMIIYHHDIINAIQAGMLNTCS
jgi:hypothetical protein